MDPEDDEEHEQLLLNDELEEELNERENESDSDERQELDFPEEEDTEDEENEGFFRQLRLRIRGRLDRDRVQRRPTTITYDPSLPVAHSYLGNDLEEYSGRTVLDEDSFVSLPLLHFPGVILIPGQLLPLHLFNQRIIAVMKHVIQHNRTFGMVHESSDRDSMPLIGTTAEIFSAKEEDDNGIETMRVKAMGRQRFQIVETRRQTDGILIGTVRIITEPELPSALEGAQLASHNKLRLIPPLNQAEGRDRDQAWLKQRRKRHLSAARWTWMQPWVYEMYDAEVLMVHIKAELKTWYEDSVKFHTVPSKPSEFSFWVASNLPLSDTQRLKLLEINCPVQRLRLELDTLKKCTMLICTNCELDIANKSDVFSYAWTILQCRGCSHHMGWKFTSVKRKLKPQMFWGLTRSAVQPGFKEKSRDSELPLI